MKFNQKQKKTATLVGMFGLLALVLGMGGQTYAKYYSSAATDAATATVAKWGLVVNANADNLFGTTYSDPDTNKLAAVSTGTNIVVNAASSTVAPGTKGSLSVSVSGVSEVKAKLTISVVVAKEVHLDDYYPMKWTQGSTVGKKLSEIPAVEIDLDATTTPFAKSYDLSWEWAFNGDDTKDTILGQYANGTALPAEYTAAEKTVEFSVKVELTQVQ